jgi:pyruvate-formate lyase-activating enzyme
MSFHCNWAFDTLVVTCDGTVVCGCADPSNERPVGHLSKSGILDIWNGPAMTEARAAIARGEPGAICKGCGLGWEVPSPLAPPVPLAPPRLLVEPTIVCNLRCPIESCEVNNSSSPPRTRRFLDAAELSRVLDDIGPQLQRIQFYNYGEPFIHRGTVAMVREIKERFPHVWVDTSTNGHFFQNDERRRELVDSGIDRLIFSVDGASQKSYARYRRGGDLQRVLDAMAGIVGYRTLRGRSKPEVLWRYILFDWNDSFWEMRKARKMARQMGIDALCWHLSLPVEGASRKYTATSRATRRIWPEFFDSGPWPNALPERRTSERPSILRARIRARVPGRVQAGALLPVEARVKNTGDSTWLAAPRPEGRFVTLGADFLDGSGRPIPEMAQRIHLPEDVRPGRSVRVQGSIRCPSTPGRHLLRLDLVNELFAWFGDLGSERALLELVVA